MRLILCSKKQIDKNAKTILGGHPLSEVVSITSHGKLGNQYFDGIHFIQLPVLNLVSSPGSKDFLQRKT